MASEGANVALLDIFQDKMEEAAEQVRGVAIGNSKVMVAKADVTDPEAVAEAFKKVSAEFGDIISISFRFQQRRLSRRPRPGPKLRRRAPRTSREYLT